MPKKKTQQSSVKPDKKKKPKVETPPAQDSEEEEEYADDEEINEEDDEEEEEDDNDGFVVNDDDEEINEEIGNNLDIYRDEKKFEKTKRELERKMKIKKEKEIKGEAEAEDDDEKIKKEKKDDDEDYEEEDDKKNNKIKKEKNVKEEEDQEQVDEVEDKMNVEESESEKKVIKKKKRLHKSGANKEIYRRELYNLQDDIYEDANNKQLDEDNSENDIREKSDEENNNYNNRRNREDVGDFIEYTHPERIPKRRDHIKAGIETLEQEYITDEERIIANADYPERLVSRYQLEELEHLYQEIKEEVDWICEQKNYNDFPNKKRKVNILLELFKKDFLDIPLIINYKYYLFEHEFELKNELWDIFELDRDYQRLLDLKKKVINNFNQLEPFLNEKIFHNMKEKCIDEAKKISDLNNMMIYINYNKEKYLPKKKNGNEEGQYLLPVAKSALIVQYNETLEKYAEQFCLNSNDIASNLELIHNKENFSKLLHPPNPDCSISEFFKNEKNENQSNIMNKIINLISKEMISHPYIKEYVYKYLRDYCFVWTTPTEEGNKQLDIFHPSFRIKRIKERPIRTFRDDLFLEACQREKEGLIDIKIEINEDPENKKNFKEIFNQALNSEDNNDNNIMYNNAYGIKQEKDILDEDNNFNYNNTIKNEWVLYRQSVIEKFLEIIQKQFIIDIKKELKEEAETIVINACAENFEKLLMGAPYVVKKEDRVNKKSNEEKKNKKKKTGKKNENNENEEEDAKNDEEEKAEEQNFDETDLKFIDAEIPRIVVFIFDPNSGITYGVALDKNGEKIDEKSFDFNFNNFTKSKQNEMGLDNLTPDQKLIKKFLEKNEPNLILIGANDLNARLIKDQLDKIDSVFPRFGDLSIPEIYANSPISDTQIESNNMYIKQAISLGRYWQSPLDEILQLWSSDVTQNFCLKIKLHPLQKYVNQKKLMEKLEMKAVKVVNSVGFDLNRGFDYSHKRNTLQFISGFGPIKAKAFISAMIANGKPSTRSEIIDENSRLNIGKKLGESFLNFIKIKTDVKSMSYNDEYNLLDMTRIPLDAYDMANKLINDVFNKENEGKGNKKQKKKDKIEEIIRHPDKYKLNELDINEFINKQKEASKNNELENYLKFTIKLIKDELTSPFSDPRKDSIELNSDQILDLLIGDENFKVGVIVVAKVIRIKKGEHVYCKLQNGLNGYLWYRDIYEDAKDDSEAKNRMLASFKPGTVFEARVKKIESSNYKIDLVQKPSIMRDNFKTNDSNADSLRNYFDLKEEDKLNMKYINAHSQKNRKYQPRNIKHDKFRNITYAECCNLLKNKEIGECYFRPSSLGNNNITLSYKFYPNIICHLDVVEGDKILGENIGKTLKINNEVYSSLDEIIKRYVIPCAQLIKESIKSRKFIQCNTKNDFEDLLKDSKKSNANIIIYYFTILKDYPGYIVLGYIPKANPHYEYIKIKPKGLYFHEQYFSSIDEIINFFKVNYSTAKYREMVAKTGTPTVQYHRSIENRNNNFSSNSINLDEQSDNRFGTGSRYHNNNYSSFGSSMGGKDRKNNYGKREHNNDNLCHICQKPGHIARNCPEKNDYGDKRREGRNNNGNYLGGKRHRDKDQHGFKKERYDKGNDYDNNKRDNWGMKKEKENEDNWGGDSNNNINNSNDNWGDNKEDDWGTKKEKDNEDNWGSSNNNDDGWGKANKEDNWEIKNDPFI